MRYVAIVSRAVVFSRVKFCEPVLGKDVVGGIWVSK